MPQDKIPASDEAWETGRLGDDPKSAEVYAADIQPQIDEALAMKPISIRLPASLVDTFKLLGEVHGLGYQPLMRRVLMRFAESEMKHLLRDYVARQRPVVEEDDEANRGAAAAR